MPVTLQLMVGFHGYPHARISTGCCWHSHLCILALLCLEDTTSLMLLIALGSSAYYSTEDPDLECVTKTFKEHLCDIILLHSTEVKATGSPGGFGSPSL